MPARPQGGPEPAEGAMRLPALFNPGGPMIPAPKPRKPVKPKVRPKVPKKPKARKKPAPRQNPGGPVIGLSPGRPKRRKTPAPRPGTVPVFA